ncbi:MAG: hypothetical protein AAGJ37_07830 [Pseudomonadota bacterium]
MTNNKVLLILKTVMIVGIVFIGIGAYCHLYSETIHAMGVKGMIISGAFVAIGMAMSLPTKMFLTFIWVEHENKKRHAQQSAKT